MHFVRPHQFEPLDIARAQRQVLVVGGRNIHHERSAADLELFERSGKCLGLGLFHIEGRDHDKLAIGKFRSQCRTQRAQQFLPGEGVVIRARLRPVNGAAVAPQWRPDRANTRPARALLFPQLLARSGNASPDLGGVRARTSGGAIVLHRLPEQIFVDRAKHLVGQFERPSFRSAQVVYIDSCHITLIHAGRND